MLHFTQYIYFVCNPIAHCLAISNCFRVSISGDCGKTESSYLLVCLAHQGPMPGLLANILNHILNRFFISLLVNLKSKTCTFL